ncbi:MAG: hypothetical protein ACP5G4_11650, partial [bacterium]
GRESLVSFFRKGDVDRFYEVGKDGQPEDLTFLEAAERLSTEPNEKLNPLPENYFDLLHENRKAFEEATTEDILEPINRPRDSVRDVIKIIMLALKDTRQLTEEQEDYLKLVKEKIAIIPKHTISEIRKMFKQLGKEIIDSREVYSIFKDRIPDTLLYPHYSDRKAKEKAEREIILSMFLKGEK